VIVKRKTAERGVVTAAPEKKKLSNEERNELRRKRAERLCRMRQQKKLAAEMRAKRRESDRADRMADRKRRKALLEASRMWRHQERMSRFAGKPSQAESDLGKVEML
jgi:hypothetical protein